MKSITFFLTLAVTCCAVYGVDFPSSWKTCKWTDAKANDCLKGAITAAAKSLKDGNKELDIEPMDPMVIDALSIEQGSSAVNLKLSFKNLKMFGMANVVIDRAVPDMKKNKFVLDYHTTTPLRLEGDYTSKGRILLIPINGVGKSTLILDNFKGSIIFNMKRTMKDGQEYLEVTKTDIIINTSRLHLNFKRNDPSQETFSKNLNTFLNANWQDLLEDLKPSISRAFSATFKSTANKIFSKFPLSKISS
ncbi:JHBP [Nesidiocoris tenuis]|uniref:JHBP n=1 Tax=Nesidiocoris tenuis TaxID=355587 RepID=A0ABN7BH88_9HEMI|nr:JHBP [Nesidiocoris tenuis]